MINKGAGVNSVLQTRSAVYRPFPIIALETENKAQKLHHLLSVGSYTVLLINTQ